MVSAAAVLIGLAFATIGGLVGVVVLSPWLQPGQAVDDNNNGDDVPGSGNLKSIVGDLLDHQAGQEGSSDSDGDGISDRDEIKIGTNPNNTDSDNDGLDDRQEVETGTSPKDKDTDGDGLADLDEPRYGTDPINRDTDGDGIDDGKEVETGTNPVNANTDGDRYRDNEDPEPVKKNSASIRITASALELRENYNSVLAISSNNNNSSGGSHVTPDAVLAAVTVDLMIRNEGDDYASFVKFDGVFLMDGVELKRINKDIGKVEQGAKVNKQLTYFLRVSDIPPNKINEIVKSVDASNLPVISFEIRNIAFERF